MAMARNWVHLTELPTASAEVLFGLIGDDVTPLVLAAGKVKPVAVDDLETWEHKLEQAVAEGMRAPFRPRPPIRRRALPQEAERAWLARFPLAPPGANPYGPIDRAAINGRRGKPYDNAKAERFMNTLKAEAVYRMEDETFTEVADDLPRFLDKVDNTKRLHPSLDYWSPVQLEEQHAR